MAQFGFKNDWKYNTINQSLLVATVTKVNNVPIYTTLLNLIQFTWQRTLWFIAVKLS